MVERPSRRGDNHFGAAPQGADLVIHRRATVERHHGEMRAFGVLMERFGHLHRELAGGDEHERARLPTAGLVAGQAIEQRQREGGGLARAGAGLAEHVAAREQHRDGLALNRGGFLVAERSDRADECLRQSE